MFHLNSNIRNNKINPRQRPLLMIKYKDDIINSKTYVTNIKTKNIENINLVQLNRNKNNINNYHINRHQYEYDFHKWVTMYNNVLYDMYKLFIVPYKDSGYLDKVKYRTFCSFMFHNSSLLKDYNL